VSGLTYSDLLTGASTIISDNNFGIVVAASAIVGIFGVLVRKLIRAAR
jgi:hypothetical protein